MRGIAGKESSPLGAHGNYLSVLGTKTCSSSEVVWVLKIKNELIHLYPNVLVISATIKNRWQHFLPIECCFEQGPQCKEARLLDYSELKRERKMSAFPKIPHVVLLHSVGCSCSPPATAPLPDGSCSSGMEVERWLLSWGFGDTANAGRSQWTPLPLPVLRKGSQWGTVPALSPGRSAPSGPTHSLPEAAAQAEESHVQTHFQTRAHGLFSSPQLILVWYKHSLGSCFSQFYFST